VASPAAEALLLVDLVLAECVCGIEPFYEVERGRVAQLMRAAIALPVITVGDAELLPRALEVYERHPLDFAEACLVARAERSGVGRVASVDAAIRL
jgi:predicted nucleic-acid-binding protein